MGSDEIRDAIAAQILSFPSPVAQHCETSRRSGHAIARESRAALLGTARAGGTDDGSFNLWLANFPLTDLGNAERFAERNKGKLLFCATLGWLFWAGKGWARDDSGVHLNEALKATVRGIADEADALRNSGADQKIGNGWLSDKIAAWAVRSEAMARMRAIAEIARSMLAIEASAFDADPFAFNVANGTLKIAKRDYGPYVELHPHDPADLITKLSHIRYDPAARCPRFDRFMDEVQPDASGGCEVRRFLYQWSGLSLTGDTSEHRVVFNHGEGRNGKSVFASIISFIAGDYAKILPIETFLDSGPQHGSQARPDLASLPGVRMLITSEAKKTARFNEVFVKFISGGDKLSARHLHKEFFTFTPQAKLTFLGNRVPKIEADDAAFWSRFILVKWPIVIPPERQDSRLVEVLKAEASGILNRLLDGLCAWLDQGLTISPSVAKATADHRRNGDPLGQFLEACTRRVPGKRIGAMALHSVFVAWAKANGEAEWSPKGLSIALRERGLVALKSSCTYWLDIELTKGATDFFE